MALMYYLEGSSTYVYIYIYIYTYIPIHIYTHTQHIYIYKYIYIERERDRYMCMYIYIYGSAAAQGICDVRGSEMIDSTAKIYTYTPIVQNTIYIILSRHCRHLLVVLYKSLSRKSVPVGCPGFGVDRVRSTSICMYIYIYIERERDIYIQREREIDIYIYIQRERERYLYTYMYIYIQRERCMYYTLHVIYILYSLSIYIYIQ